jgi:CoA:oxalate CoA-transferase
MTSFLNGFRVLDFGQAIAGTYVTQMLGDMGADVIKIENVPRPEPVTSNSPEDVEINQWMCNHWAHNRNKRGICLDMKNPKGKAVFYDLLKHSDVVFDNFRPHVLKNLGIDYDTIKELNPRIISCSVTGFGHTGPWKEIASFDLIAQAMGGTMSLTGEPGGMPTRCGVAIGDIIPAMFAAFAISSALVGREKTGKGQRIDVGMFDCQLAIQTYRVPAVFTMGKTFVPNPRMSGAASQVPYGPYKCSDGEYIAIAGGAVQFWGPICKAVGREDLMNDARFDTNTKRQERHVELSRIFEETFIQKTADEWEKALLEVRVPATKVRNIREAFLHPQAQDREMLISIDDHPLGRKMKIAASPIKIASPEDRIEYREAPALGEHTVEVLSGLLGYSSEKLSELKTEGVTWWAEKGIFYSADFARFA